MKLLIWSSQDLELLVLSQLLVFRPFQLVHIHHSRLHGRPWSNHCWKQFTFCQDILMDSKPTSDDFHRLKISPNHAHNYTSLSSLCSFCKFEDFRNTDRFFICSVRLLFLLFGLGLVSGYKLVLRCVDGACKSGGRDCFSLCSIW